MKGSALTFEEKKKLSEDIGGLNEEQQIRVIQIIQSSMPKLTEACRTLLLVHIDIVYF